MTDRFLGPTPPQVVLPLPTLLMMTVRVTMQAVKTRLTMKRRHFPLISVVRRGVVEPYLRMPDRRLYVQVDMVAIARRVAAQKRQPHAKLFVTQVLAQPPPVVTEIQVTSVAVRGRLLHRPVHSDLSVPATLDQDQLDLLVQFAPQSSRHPARRTHSFLSEPVVAAAAVAAVAPEASVTLVGRRRPRIRSFLAAPVTAPAVVQVFAGPRVKLALSRRSRPLSRLRTGVVEQYLRAPDRRLQVQAVLAGRTRLETQRRAPHSRISPPTAVLPLPTLRVQTIQATLVKTRPRHTIGRVRAPATLVASLGLPAGPKVKLVKTRPRKTFYRLGAPQKILPLPTQREQTVRSVLAAVRTRVTFQRRAPHFDLLAPTVVHIPVTYVITLTASNLSIRARLRKCVNRLMGGDTSGTLTMSGDTAGTQTVTTDLPGTQLLTADTPGTLNMDIDTPGDLGEADPDNC
jgi:hypothetical protein